MRKTKLTVKPTTAFRKDYKLALKRGLKIELLETQGRTVICSENEPDAVWGYLYGIFFALFAGKSASYGRESLRIGGVSDMMERSIKNDVRERREYEELQDCG